jgi:hypothetical protein
MIANRSAQISETPTQGTLETGTDHPIQEPKIRGNDAWLCHVLCDGPYAASQVHQYFEIFI